VIAVAKKQRGILVSEVSRIFDDDCIRDLATNAKFPSHADFVRFAEGLRDAATSYAVNVVAPTNNEMRHEVRALFKAAGLKRPRYREVAMLLDRLSPQTRDSLNDRSARLKRPALPASAALLNKAQRKDACDLIVTLCRVGIGCDKPLNVVRSSAGAQTWNHKSAKHLFPDRGVLLHAPYPQRNFRKRQAEECFVTDIRLAWLVATGEPPAMTVNPGEPGPFARMVQKCFDLAQAHANATGVINNLHSKRRKKEERVPLPEDIVDFWLSTPKG
jgi:hypothetical protein